MKVLSRGIFSKAVATLVAFVMVVAVWPMFEPRRPAHAATPANGEYSSIWVQARVDGHDSTWPAPYPGGSATVWYVTWTATGGLHGLPGSLYCADSGDATVPNGGYFEGYAYFDYADIANGRAVYKIAVAGLEDPVHHHANGFQRASSVEITAYLPWSYTGQVRVQKSSSNPSITTGNECYSLAGAEYGVYSTPANAALGGTNGRIALLTTNAAGITGYSGNINLNTTVYIRELVAPTGYMLDDTIYPTVVNSSLVTKPLTDTPREDPAQALVQKVDVRTDDVVGLDDPTGATLAGAEFTITYWDGYYNTEAEAIASGAPTAKWVMLTDNKGKLNFQTARIKAGSSPVYLNTTGTRTVPLGTFTVKETLPPAGYLLPTPNVADVVRVVVDPMSTFLAKEYVITPNGMGGYFSTERTNALEVAETPHELVITKTDAETGEAVDNTEFTVYKNTGSVGAPVWTEVVVHESGTGDVDNDGIAEAGKALFSPISVGSYKVVETRAAVGYQNAREQGLPEQYFTIEATTTVLELAFSDYKLQTIETWKVDIDTGEPVGDTLFTLYYLLDSAAYNGVVSNTFRLDSTLIAHDDPRWVRLSAAFVTDALGNVVAIGTGTAPEVPLIDTQTTDATGVLYWEDLPFGYYKIEETRPHNDYATLLESEGTQSAGNCHFLTVDSTYEASAQVFRNKLIGVSTEVVEDAYDWTISSWSTGLMGRANPYVHVNSDEAFWWVSARSTSNVWADEYAVTVDLKGKTALDYRLDTLRSGVATAAFDMDGVYSLLIQTNYSSGADKPTYTTHPLAGNIYNPNNPTNTTFWTDADGWKTVAEGVEVGIETEFHFSAPDRPYKWPFGSTHFADFTAWTDIPLDRGEYVTGVRFVYGGVLPGFTMGDEWGTEVPGATINAPKRSQMYTDGDSSGILAFKTAGSVATQEPLAEMQLGMKSTIIRDKYDENGQAYMLKSVATSNIARNGSLYDEAVDDYTTLLFEAYITTPETKRFGRSGGRSHWWNLPQTGGSSPIDWLLAGGLAVVAVLSLAWLLSPIVKRQRTGEAGVRNKERL